MKQPSTRSVPIQCVLFLLITAGVYATVEQCSQTYTTSSGRTCHYCGPGTHKHADCLEEGRSALCLTCPGGTWQKHCNIAAFCAACDLRCRQPYTVKIKECTLYENIVCECQEGSYWRKESSDTGVCLKHSECPRGHGMVKLGTQYNDTDCRSCIEGHTYSDEKSLAVCTPCTECLEYNTTCVVTNDAECENPRRETTTETSTAPIEREEESPNYGVIAVILGIPLIPLLILTAMFCYNKRRRKCSKSISEDKQPSSSRDGQCTVEMTGNVTGTNRNLPPRGIEENNTSCDEETDQYKTKQPSSSRDGQCTMEMTGNVTGTNRNLPTRGSEENNTSCDEETDLYTRLLPCVSKETFTASSTTRVNAIESSRMLQPSTSEENNTSNTWETELQETVC